MTDGDASGRPLRVALLQMVSHGMDSAANLAKGDAFCRRAHASGADIALFPEMWNIGYSPCPMPDFGDGDRWRSPGRWGMVPVPAVAVDPATAVAVEGWRAAAIDRSDPFFAHFQSLARELRMAVAITYLERWPGAPRNSVSLIDRQGNVALTYAKVHTCAFGMEDACTPGDEFHVCDLDTAAGPVRVGAMICFDREFPESARILMLKGAELILTPNACDIEPNRLAQFRTRAFENMVGMAMATYAAPQQNGHSVAYHPMAFDDAGRSRELCLMEADETEGVHVAEFPLAEMRAYREREVWGNAFRRPSAYAALTSSEVQSPFCRVDAAGRTFPATVPAGLTSEAVHGGDT